ncbi:MAG: undecaprenyldiphospho-muramoylpentapeptide beta-N-acetylglucosaminyltransferase [Thermodesulfobacteriota bacterium]
MRMIISGGGTGGHLFPGVAVAEEVLHSVVRGEILFVATDRETDAKVLSGKPFPFLPLKSQGIKGKSIVKKLGSLFQLPMSLWTAWGIIGKFKPDVVLGVGGYVTGPVLLAAWLRRIPTCIHEQNSVPGMANRILAKIVRKIFISIPGSEKRFPSRKCVQTGNPVRKEVRALASGEGGKDNFTLVVMGGSLGAHSINVKMMEAARLIKRSPPEGFNVIHQTGRQDTQKVKDTYKEAGIPAKVASFFNQMPFVLAKADLVVARAGATSLAELTVMGKPMILIPYPYAADNHQEINADWLVQAGAAMKCMEDKMSGMDLAKLILGLAKNESKRARMASMAYKLGEPNAAKNIVRECLDLASAHNV